MSELPKILRKPPPLPKSPPPLPSEPSGPSGPSSSPPPHVMAVPRSAGSVWLLRVGMLVACAGSCWLLYWSVTARLQPASRQFKDKTMEMTALANEVELLRRKWEERDVEQTKARYAAVQKFLVSSPADLRDWEQEVRTKSAFTSLETMCQWARPEPHPAAKEKLGRITGQLVVRPAFVPGMTNTPYQRLLDFSRRIADTPKRFDLVRLSVDGNSNSVKNAVAVVQLLSTETEAEEE